jgi:hypothetical protein
MSGADHRPVDLEWVVAQRRRDENNTRECPRRGAFDYELAQRWWEPHLVYVLHVHAEGLYEVGLTRHDSRRIRDLTARGRANVVDSLLVANRHAARLVEIAVLDATDSARRLADRLNHHDGQTEHWDDSLTPLALEPIAAAVSLDEYLVYWFATLPSREAESYKT